MDFWQDSLFRRSVLLAIGFPLLIILLTEVIERLDRRGHALAPPLRQVRNIVLPLLAVLLVMRYILGYGETVLFARLVTTLFWVTLMVVAFMAFKPILAEVQPRWSANVPALLLQLPRVLLALVVAYYILASVWSVNVGEMITALGVGSLVIALALQDSLNNLFSGLLLSFNRSFQVGDWLQIGDVEGKVVEVNWRASLLRTRDNDLVVIPNGSMAKSTFKNYSRPTRLHRVRERFNLHIDNLPHKVRQVLNEAALATPQVLADPAPEVRTISYDGASVQYDVFFWIADYNPVANIRNEFMTRAYYYAKRNGLKWPKPERELHHYDGPALEAARTVTTEQRAELLKTLPSFARLPDAAIEVLADASELLEYGQDEHIVRAGGQERGIYVLTGGRVSVARIDAQSQQREITQLGVGDFFGETGLFGRSISSVTVTALEIVEVILIPHRVLNDVINKHPGFADEMSALIEERKRLIRRAQSADASLALAPSTNGKATVA